MTSGIVLSTTVRYRSLEKLKGERHEGVIGFGFLSLPSGHAPTWPHTLCPSSDLLSASLPLDPVDYMSSCTLDHISSTMMWSGDSRNGYTTAMLRLDAGVEASDTYGMPYTIVSSKPALLKLNFGQDEDYRDESDFYLSTGVKTTGDDDSTSQAYLRCVHKEELISHQMTCSLAHEVKEQCSKGCRLSSVPIPFSLFP